MLVFTLAPEPSQVSIFACLFFSCSLNARRYFERLLRIYVTIFSCSDELVVSLGRNAIIFERRMAGTRREGASRSQKQHPIRACRPARYHLSQGMYIHSTPPHACLSRLCAHCVPGLRKRRHRQSPRAVKATSTSPRLCDRRCGVIPGTAIPGFQRRREDRPLRFRVKTKGKSMYCLFVRAALILPESRAGILMVEACCAAEATSRGSARCRPSTLDDTHLPTAGSEGCRSRVGGYIQTGAHARGGRRLAPPVSGSR